MGRFSTGFWYLLRVRNSSMLSRWHQTPFLQVRGTSFLAYVFIMQNMFYQSCKCVLPIVLSMSCIKIFLGIGLEKCPDLVWSFDCRWDMVLVKVTSLRKCCLHLQSERMFGVITYWDRFSTSFEVPKIVAKQEMRSHFLILWIPKHHGISFQKHPYLISNNNYIYQKAPPPPFFAELHWMNIHSD